MGSRAHLHDENRTLNYPIAFQEIARLSQTLDVWIETDANFRDLRAYRFHHGRDDLRRHVGRATNTLLKL